MRCRIVLLILLFALIIAGCPDNSDDSDETDTFPFCTSEPLEVEVISTHFVEYGSETFEYQLLRLTCGDHPASYAQFFLPPSAKKSACIMETMPYDNIIWTGEQIDIDYAEETGYYLEPDLLVESANLHLYHGFGVLFVYGRFYTGYSILNDVNDMIAGLKYLEQEELADNDKIAIAGGSWGGFEAVYGACYAPDTIKPLVGVAYYPVTDFKKWYQYSGYPEEYINDQEKLDEYTDFFSPYIDRINLYTGGGPYNSDADFSYFNHEDLSDYLDTKFLVVHDSWDTLVPIGNSLDFYAMNKDLIHPMWFYHDGDIDYDTFDLNHGDLLANDSVVPAYYTWAFIFAYKELTGPYQNILMVYDPEALDDFCSYVKDFDDNGYEMDWGAERFLDFFDDRILLLNSDTATIDIGKSVITNAINTAWGTSYSEYELEILLANGLP